MKLPTFFEFGPLVSLKRRMGIPDDVYGTFDVAFEPGRLTPAELQALVSGDGIDVSFDELTILADGTLAYKDSRVLLYIRDIADYGDRKSEGPRYHLANCSTLREMAHNGRFDRYVIATEANGVFSLNIISNGKTRREKRALSVCQNCLTQLSFDGFQGYWRREQRVNFVSGFAPGRFFEIYPQSLHSKRPTYDAVNAPLNNYKPDFEKVSRLIREQRGWKCERCNMALGAAHLRRFLHVHHVNAQKWDDRPSNLKALCIGCHVSEPAHAHLKSSPDYRAFLAATGRTR